MFKNSADIKLKHKRFLEEVIKTQEVYTLKNEKRYVSSSSNHFEDEAEEPLLLQIFWSNEKEANLCSRKVWDNEDFKLDLVTLKDFLELWCTGMHKDNVIIGTNFDHNLFGYEEEPLVLAKNLLELAKSNRIELDLKNYSSTDEYLEIINNHLKEEE